MVAALLGAGLAVTGRFEALSWPLVGHSCPAPPLSSLAACTYPRPEWRDPLVWTIAGAVLGVVIAVAVVAVSSHRLAGWFAAFLIVGWTAMGQPVLAGQTSYEAYRPTANTLVAVVAGIMSAAIAAAAGSWLSATSTRTRRAVPLPS